MRYRKGYKFQLYEDEEIRTGIYGKNIKTDFIELFANGVLIGRKGYAWDGASFFLARDNKHTVRGTLFHDIGYQLIREGLLTPDYKAYFDGLLYLIITQDGLNKLEATVWYRAVWGFGKSSTLPEHDREILEAP